VYERFPEERKEYLDRLTSDRVELVKPHTPDMDPERRERLAREYTVLSEIQARVDFDLWAGIGENAAEDARGFLVKEDVVIDGETYTVDKPNPALTRSKTVSARRREIREELRLWEAYREDDAEDQTLAEALSDE
jgi:hypothetical protein